MDTDLYLAVYIYRTVLDLVNGVSSTRATSIASLTLKEGEIRQLHFVEDNTLMVLWCDGSMFLALHVLDCIRLLTPCTEGSSYLLNFPFQPASAQQASEKADPSSFVVEYTDCEAIPTNTKPTVQAMPLDLESLIQTGVVRHAFAVSGPKAKPVHLDVNGRKDRRAVCVLYADGMRYDVLDLDAAMDNEEYDEDEEVEMEAEGR